MMLDLSEFDVYCDEHGITVDETPVAFAAWMYERGMNVDLGLITETIPTHITERNI